MSINNNSGGGGGGNGSELGGLGNSLPDANAGASSTESPLLSIFTSASNAVNSSRVQNQALGMTGAQDTLDLSSILPAANVTSSGSGNSASITSLPLDTDIDQLMKSLGDSVDTSKVSDDDLDKLLGSINASFSTSMPLAAPVASIDDSDPLAALSRDLGIDLSTPVAVPSTPSASLGDGAALSASPSVFTPSGISAGAAASSTPESPALQSRNGLSAATATQQQHINVRPTTPRPQLAQQQKSTASTHTTPQHTPVLGNMQSRPQLAQTPQQRNLASATASSPISTGPNTPTPQQQQPQQPRPSRPLNQTSVTPRPGSKPRAVHGGGGSARGHGQQRSPPPNGSPRSQSPANQRPPRPAHPNQMQQQQQQQQQHINMLHFQQQQQQQRPQQTRPSPRPMSMDPSRWLANTMSTLPPEQQERLAGLFRGLQSKTVDFQTFARDAESIMGPKFQDLISLMRNQGTRLPHPMQAQQPRPGDMASRQSPMASAGMQAGVTSMLRPNHPLSISTGRPGAMDMSGLSTMQARQAGMSLGTHTHGPPGPLADNSRNAALIRQLLAQQRQQQQQQQQQGGEGFGTAPPSSDMRPLALSASTSSSLPMAPSPMQGMMSAPGANSFEAILARGQSIILNPTISSEQLARLSMQLSAYGDLLANPNGPMGSMSEEVRSQQFMQISKLQALIAHRQFSGGSSGAGVQAGASSSSSVAMSAQTDSRPASPDPKKKGKEPKEPKEPKKKAAAKSKKRAADSRRPGSPAPGKAKKLKSSASDVGSEPDVEMLATQLALAGPALSLQSISALSAAGSGQQGGGNAALVAGLSAGGDGVGGDEGYVDEPDSGDDTGGNKRKEADADKSKDDLPLMASASFSPAVRKAKASREKERGADSFAIDDVIGYAGVDLREESEIIMGGLSSSTRTRTRLDEGVRHGSHMVNGVEIAYDTALLASANFASVDVLEAFIARACRSARISRVSEEVVPLLTMALHERLRSYMEIVSAAAHHRTRTQTLPPPPLDPTTRLPLYKITPHQDVRRQLAVLERRDRLYEQAREKTLRDREHFNATGELRAESSGEPGGGASETAGSGAGLTPGPGGEDAADIAGKPKRPRKRDDSAPETPAYTSKNMPEDIRNKFSNQTALRAAGGVRKSWMNVASKPDWLTSAPASSSFNSLSKPASFSGGDAQDAASDFGAVSASGHKRGKSSLGAASEFDAAPDTPTSTSGAPSSRPPPGLISHRSTSLAAPLLITVRDCLFSLERERLGSVRVSRGSGDRVLIQAYTNYLHD
ncbi:hypothetical protein FB645_001225 [Coemansia sp. IMI 203386]|nr:hypothetical protein FB645_001225 [Coemansia sp. IMI 203386]